MIFITGNKHGQLFSLKWWAHFLHFQENAYWIPRSELEVCEWYFQVKVVFHEKAVRLACNSDNCVVLFLEMPSYSVCSGVFHAYFPFSPQRTLKRCVTFSDKMNKSLGSIRALSVFVAIEVLFCIIFYSFLAPHLTHKPVVKISLFYFYCHYPYPIFNTC